MIILRFGYSYEKKMTDPRSAMWNRIHLITIRGVLTRQTAIDIGNVVLELRGQYDVCYFNARTYLMQNMAPFENRHALISWGIDFHNSVNARLGKQIWDERMFYQKYSKEMNAAQ